MTAPTGGVRRGVGGGVGVGDREEDVGLQKNILKLGYLFFVFLEIRVYGGNVIKSS